ncbi:hypothetical protein [Pseudomonas sp. UMAB-40]|uniref:hypothetical protein n=1 Tax=Pseudomonas sp. UMAB-40 TaxID=1365407 RepID=UPI001C577440|nr:hypothetical protein [Pseudomonas sp. UMAB-40]
MTTSKNAPQYTRPVTFLPVVVDGVETAVVFEYRGRSLEVTFVVDENDLQLDDVRDLACSAEEVAEFERGEWFFHQLCVYALDADGNKLELCDAETEQWDSGLPNFRNHNELIYSLCDMICDELDECDFPLSFSGFFVDWNGDTRKVVQGGNGAEYACTVDKACKRADVFNRAGECIFEADVYLTLEDIAKAGVVVNLIK